MFSWLSKNAEIPETSWEENSKFHLFKLRYFTVSEYDHHEKSQIYYKELVIPENENFIKVDYLPLNFLSSFYISTHKGKLKLGNISQFSTLPIKQIIYYYFLIIALF